MEPRQLCSKLLHNCPVGPGFGEGSHVFEVAGGEAGHLREGRLEVDGEPIDDPGAPALMVLPGEDLAADLPVKQHHVAIDREGRADLGRLDAIL